MVVTDFETGAVERRSVTVRASDQTTSAIEGDVSEGDEVLYSKYGGTEVKYDDETYKIVSSSDILAVIG